MRARFITLLAIIIGTSLCSEAQGLADVMAALRQASPFAARARFETQLPQGGGVDYNVELMSEANVADTLAPCRYLIEWETLNAAGDTTSGFTAYYDGHLYQQRRGELMREWHAKDAPWQFAPGGDATRGAQARALFAGLLPQFMATRLAALDSATAQVGRATIDGRECVTVKGTIMRSGVAAAIVDCAFFASTLLPARWNEVGSPDTPGEQTIDATFSYDSLASLPAFTDEAMSARHPQAFGPLRRSTFRAENLRGLPLPSFACRTLGNGGERLTHTAGEPLGEPSVIVFLPPGAASKIESEMVEAISAAAAQAEARVLLACRDRWADTELPESLARGCTVLIHSRSMAAACGVKEFPTVVVADSEGTVREIAVGVNNMAAAGVIECIKSL